MLQMIEQTFLMRVKRMETREDTDSQPIYEIELDLVNLSESAGPQCSQKPCTGSITVKTKERSLFEMARPGFLFEMHQQRLPNVYQINAGLVSSPHPMSHGPEKRY